MTVPRNTEKATFARIRESSFFGIWARHRRSRTLWIRHRKELCEPHQRLLRGRMARVALAAVSLVAALSMGGAFVASVVLAPLLVLAARESTRLEAAGYSLLAGVLMAEVAWGATYLLVAEQKPTIWLVPVLVGAATLAAAMVMRHGRHGTAPP